MPETKRKPKESFESLLRRFSKQIQQSGKLLQAKKVRYFKRPKSDQKIRESALRKKKIDEKKEYLKKIGKWKEGGRNLKTLLKM